MKRAARPAVVVALAAAFAVVAARTGLAPRPLRAQVPSPVHDVFIRGAVENADFTQVTLPVYRGTSHGETVYYVVTESDNLVDARARGVNVARKLAFAHGTAAVQRVKVVNGVIDFPATVDFSATRQLAAGPTGYPPATATPGPMGEFGYSPLIELPDGTILNASHVANDTGQAPKVLALDVTRLTVTYLETGGFYNNQDIHYASFDSSSLVTAAIENVTYAPLLLAAQQLDEERPPSAREGLIAFTNGQTGATNPQHQGLNSTLLDGLPPNQDPLNVISEDPPALTAVNSGYSPLWDVRLAAWTPAVVAAGQYTLQRDFKVILGLAQQGQITNPDGTPFSAAGFIVNCPVISE